MGIKKQRNQFFYNKRPGTCRIEGKIPLTHDGAVGTVSIPGVTSVVKVSAGLYTINLNEKYLGLVGWHIGMQNTATDGYQANLVSDAFVDGNEGTHAMINSYDGYAQIQILQADGTGAATLCNGMAIWFALDLKTSAVG